MELVDTHCHIQSIGLDIGERTTRQLWAKNEELTAQKVIDSASEHGVTKLICVGCDLDDSKLAIDFVQNYKNCWASVGIHPHEAKHYASKQEKLEQFAQLASQNKVIAIGECGLDYYYEHSPKKDQKILLEFQIELALKTKLPIIFHVRDAFDDFWPIFDKYSDIKGVLHSYTDNSENLKKAIDRNLYIGINGIATFVKDDTQVEVYKSIPLNNLLLETDAPFLTPTPYRGKVNEPKRLGATADFLSELRGEDRKDLAKITTANANKLFGI